MNKSRFTDQAIRKAARELGVSPKMVAHKANKFGKLDIEQLRIVFWGIASKGK